MAPVNPNSRAAQVRRAEIVLTRLLKTPKTRNGLVAAVTSKKISRNFVFGWLANQVVSGGVIKLKSGMLITYQIKGEVILENPALSEFPSWLDPRSLPAVSERKVFVDGLLVESKTSDKEGLK
jgi:hypothetical protein